MVFYAQLGLLYDWFPRRKQLLVQELEYVHPLADKEVLLGKNLVLAFLAGVAASILVVLVFGLPNWALAAGLPVFFLVAHAFLYGYVGLQANKHAERIERSLPDFLILYAEGLTAGLSMRQALRACARDEFGPLKDHISRALSDINFQVSPVRALEDMAGRVKSRKFEKSIALITSSIKRGGDLSQALQAQAEQLMDENALKRLISANTQAYRFYVLAGITFGFPLFLALSIIIVKIFGSLSANFSGSVGSSFGLSIFTAAPQVDAHFLVLFDIALITIACIMSSMVQGQIAKGSSKAGLVYLPLQIVVSIGLFLLALKFGMGVFGGPFGLG